MNLSTQKVEKAELCRYAQILGCDFVFYDKFVRICKMRGISPSKAAVEAGLSKSTVTKWKTSPNAAPTGAAIRKITDFFGITIAELMEEESNNAPTNAGERKMSDAELKFALWGDCTDVSDEDLADVRRYAAFVRERKKG